MPRVAFFVKKIMKKYLPAGPAGCMRRNSDNTKIQELTGWKPNYPLEKGLENTYKFIKELFDAGTIS